MRPGINVFLICYTICLYTLWTTLYFCQSDMCNKKFCSETGSDNHLSDMDQESDSDVSMSESESDENEDTENENNESQPEEIVEDEEDDTIKAIIKECNKERDHPPTIKCEDFITDLSFHPQNNIIAVANIVGDVLLYRYTNEENELIDTLELHTKACRDVEFSHDGNILFSTSKDKSVMLSDVGSGKLIRFYEDCHEVAVYCLTVIDENIFSTGEYILFYF